MKELYLGSSRPVSAQMLEVLLPCAPGIEQLQLLLPGDAQIVSRRMSAGLSVMGYDLLAPLRAGTADVLVFNPPYVPTDELPAQDDARLAAAGDEVEGSTMSASARFDRDSYLLSLSYAGGRDGMEITDRLIDALPASLSGRGCAYILLCAGNKPDEVKARIQEFGPEWRVLTVGDSGKQAGWEKLQVIRIWRDHQVAV